MKQWLTIGRITGVHGIRGEVKAAPMTDDPARFDALTTVWVVQKKKRREYAVDGVRFHKGQVLLTLKGVADRTAAEKLKGATLEVARADAVPLAEDEIFIVDLIGLTVTDAQDAPIGTVADVITTSGPVNTLDIALADGGKHVYVPFRRVFFPAWDLDAGTLSSDIPQDYFDL